MWNKKTQSLNLFLMDRFFRFIEKHSKLVVLIIVILTVFFAFMATGLKLNTSYGAFLPRGEGFNYYHGGIDGQVPFGPYEEDPRFLEDSADESVAEEDVSTSENKEPAEPSPSSVNPDGSVDYPYWTNYLVMVESDNLYTAGNLNLIDECLAKLSARRELSTPSSALDFITLEKVGSRLGIVPIADKAGDTWTEDEAETLKRHIENDPILKYYIIGGNGNSILYSFSVSNVGQAELDEFDEILQPLKDAGLSVYTNGGSVINAKVFEYLNKDLKVLVTLCLIVILIVYYLCFRSKRSVLIPMSLSLIALIWTFGTMAAFGLELTIINVVTPCMVITLGSAYSIHVLSEYYSDYQKGYKVTAVQSTRKILRTIVLACVTTILGFLCLVISETDGLKEFGYSVSIGIGYCAILACIYLPAVLNITPPPKPKQIKNYSQGFMAKLVGFLSTNIVKYWKLLLVVFCILAVAFFAVKDKIPMDSNYMSYFPKSDPFGEESRHFASEMGGTNPFWVRIEVPKSEKGFFLERDNLAKVYDYQQAIVQSPDVLQIVSFPSYVSFAQKVMTGEAGIPESRGMINMLSRMLLIMQRQMGSALSYIMDEDATGMSLMIQHWDSEEKDLMTVSSIDRVNDLLVENLNLLPEGTKVTISGEPIVNLIFSERLFSDQQKSTILSILVVFLVALIAFKSAVRGAIVIIPVLSGIMINYIFMFLSGIPFDMVTVSFSSIAIGCGVDDAIHFMIRYIRKRRTMLDRPYTELISETIRETGRPIILTTVSIVFGMMMLSFGSYTPIRYFGLLMSVTLFGCMCSTLIFMPPFMILLNKFIMRHDKKMAESE